MIGINFRNRYFFVFLCGVNASNCTFESYMLIFTFTDNGLSMFNKDFSPCLIQLPHPIYVFIICFFKMTMNKIMHLFEWFYDWGVYFSLDLMRTPSVMQSIWIHSELFKSAYFKIISQAMVDSVNAFFTIKECSF